MYSVMCGVQFTTATDTHAVSVLVDEAAGRWLQLIRTTDSAEHANVAISLQGACAFSLVSTGYVPFTR